jgi:predicted nucleotidyltransferase
MPEANRLDPDVYRASAIDVARAAIALLAQKGVRAMVTGSLARGSFSPHSDIDILVTDCPHHLKYAIEGSVEDALAGFTFDVIYADELPAWKLRHFVEGAVDADELR